MIDADIAHVIVIESASPTAFVALCVDPTIVISPVDHSEVVNLVLAPTIVTVSAASSLTEIVDESVVIVAGGNQGPQGIQGVGEPGPPGPPGAGSSVQDNFIASALVLANRFVVLSGVPADPLKVELVIYGGPEQQPGVDFLVTGSTLSWDGLAVQLLLDLGAAFSVRYIT